MADLNDRGQILLIAGFALSVIFVALALVVNGAIFTENLASQGEDSGADTVLQLRNEVNNSVGAVLEYENNRTSGSPEDIHDAVNTSIDGISTQLNRYHIVNGVNVSVRSTGEREAGTYIEDVSPGGSSLVAADGEPNWRLAQNVQQVRNFRLEIVDADQSVTGGDPDAFAVNATQRPGGTDQWRLFVGEDSGEPAIRVLSPTADETCVLSGESYPLTIDVMEATFGGEHCPPLEDHPFAEGVGTNYNLNLNRTAVTHVEGNYSLVLDGSTIGSNLANSRPTVDPFEKNALYSITVEISVRTPDLVYVDESVRIAPGEIDE